MRTKTVIHTAAILVLAGVFHITAWSQTTGNDDITAVSYRIKPIPQADRTNVEIAVRFKAPNDNSISIKLPTDNFGTPDLYKYVSSFTGDDGTDVSNGSSPNERLVKPASDGTVALRYTLSYDPRVMENYAYGPNTGPGYFHLAGCQWLLHIGDDSRKRRYAIQLAGLPTGWKVYTSVSTTPAKFEINASYDDLLGAPFGGGVEARKFSVKSGRVSVFVHGKFAIARDDIYRSVEKIIRLQRSWFNDFSQRDLTVVVAPRPWVVSGYAPDNSLICFVKPDITRAQLYRIVAHELFHNWLPNQIEIVQDKQYSDLRYEWFSEGFTDYFARRILMESGLMTKSEFVGSINDDLKSIADNPYGTATYAELRELEKTGKYGTAAKKLAYFRGAVIALNWDTQIRRNIKGKTLADFIRGLYQLASRSGGKIAEADFETFAKQFGLNASGDVKAYIMEGKDIVPEAEAFGSMYRLQEVQSAAFDIGFSLAETQRTRKITGIATNGPAANAGLANGMEFVGVENSSRFSYAWDKLKPMVVIVRVAGTERRISYYPEGKRHSILNFVKLNTGSH